ncbi:MAG: hypothetical protein D3923_14605 [Candidatus Electrothrix sp. AR3]|nr:hypothetical protein [Candidatus Electrothrix sp. AR3]
MGRASLFCLFFVGRGKSCGSIALKISVHDQNKNFKKSMHFVGMPVREMSLDAVGRGSTAHSSGTGKFWCRGRPMCLPFISDFY